MTDSILTIDSVDAFYGSAHVLQGLSATLGGETVAIVGRNGMGKTTLCRAIVGMSPPRVRGSIRFGGRELLGRPPYEICRLGISYVPQGRRMFPSLSVEEHLLMVGRQLVARGRWSIQAVYDLFPRLAERKSVGASQLSGGEQQMLAIGRALLTNPTLVVMDEPSEGLAPAVVEHLVETCRALVTEGVTLLIVEQNLSVATSVADRLLVMVSGAVAADTRSQAFLDDPQAQRRYLGVEPVSGDAATDPRSAGL